MSDITLVEGVIAMSGILMILGFGIWILTNMQEKEDSAFGVARWLPDENNLAKRQFEIWALQFTVVWIGVFAVVIVTKAYENFDANSYMILCSSLAMPYLLQPIVYPLPAEKNLPLFDRYSFKANAWIAVFSFIGNYWYTHYFYSVLKSFYDFPSLRLNNVPICLYFATHFYFITYHTFSNLILRQIETRYKALPIRSVLFWMAVISFSYFTAFMETLTISSFEHYGFDAELKQVFVLGSAFYGMYFLVSFPVFYRLDEKVNRKNGVFPHTVFQTMMECLGTSMAVLLLLDFCRLYLGVELNISGLALCQNENLKQCAGLFNHNY